MLLLSAHGITCCTAWQEQGEAGPQQDGTAAAGAEASGNGTSEGLPELSALFAGADDEVGMPVAAFFLGLAGLSCLWCIWWRRAGACPPSAHLTSCRTLWLNHGLAKLPHYNGPQLASRRVLL